MEDRERLYATIVGDRSADYYLDLFERFDRDGKTSPTFNKGAWFGVGLWFLWRRLWLPGLIYICYAAALILAVLMAYSWIADVWEQVSHGHETRSAVFRFVTIVSVYLMGIGAVLTRLEGLLSLFSLVLSAVAAFPLFYGNALYYRYCNRRIDDAIRRHKTLGAAEQALIREGSGGSVAGVVVGVVLLVGMVNFGWAKLHEQARQDAMARLVDHANTNMQHQLRLIADMAYEFGPTTLSVVAPGYPQPEAPKVREPVLRGWPDHRRGNIGILVDDKPYYFKNGDRSGDYILTLVGGRNGMSIVYSPLLRPDGRIEWVCASRGFDARLLPASCRDLR